MAEYIDLKAAIKMMRGSAIAKYPLSFSSGIMAAADELQKMPAADVAPVLHGRWRKGGYVCGETEWKCSSCGETEWRTSIYRFKYCPFCGAIMDLEVKNAEE